MTKRQTLAKKTDWLRGVGLHSGVESAVRISPAPGGAGRVFRGRDGQEIAARAANVADTSRCTRLAASGLEVQTVEHLLSALAGLGIDDAVIEIDGPEVPALDGSAAPFATAVLDAGLRETEMARDILIVTQPLLLSEESGALIAVVPADHFQVTVILDYPKHAFLGTLAATFDAAAGSYVEAIAPARTFGFLSEIEWLRARGLGMGASYENAVVLREDGYDSSLRFSDELARHKILDVIGDLALVGRPVCAQIFAVRPSHTLNVRLAAALSQLSAGE